MDTMTGQPATRAACELFLQRHIGPAPADRQAMLDALGCPTLEHLIGQTIPASLRTATPLAIEPPASEDEALTQLRGYAAANRVLRSWIGLGYHDCVTPPAIQRHVLENPRWYTPYTPYQAEIAQGRLELLLVFQTMIAELTGLPLAGASLLDESTAAAEAMTMAHGLCKQDRRGFYVVEGALPQTLALLRTRAHPLGFTIHTGPAEAIDYGAQDLFGVLVQVPGRDGAIHDYAALAEAAHAAGALFVAACDPLALALLTPPGQWGADIAVGSTQRLGMPMGLGGPHAAFIATRDEYKRSLPGRIAGLSRDAQGRPALRLALQTREQHIRRERASSNICTAQVLPAIVAALYGVWHGPEGLTAIAGRVRGAALALAEGLRRLGYTVGQRPFFDTVTIEVSEALWRDALLTAALEQGINLGADEKGITIALGETVTPADLDALLAVFAEMASRSAPAADELLAETGAPLPAPFARAGAFMTQEVFHAHRSEAALARWLHRLASRDISLLDSMIPLGSCTMKLNAAAEMAPISWPQWGALHPFVPADQAAGYARLFADLERWLGSIIGLPAVSLQPNAGSQGEYAGLLAIRAWHEAHGDGHRDVCLIPASAHGTNPASAVMAGLRVVGVACDAEGNIDLDDLSARAAEHADRLAAVMITYPSTHGVFEEGIKQACATVHAHGGQVYLDGANLNALVGLVRPGELGADVCHINLHKTFCIPHGGGGPGMGPICAGEHLRPHLPSHPLVPVGGAQAYGPVSAAPWGSALILTISWMYIRMMGGEGLALATAGAILNANYMAHRLKDHYKIVYTGPGGRCAHEFIIDLRPFKKTADITPDDVAKRLMDYGFHAPTMSFPVAGTLMIEPTESEPLAELDRFCEAMLAIREEIRAIEEGQADRVDNPLRNAPHTAAVVTADDWTHPYSRRQAAWPAPWLEDGKYWPPVGRVDNAYGDRNLICQCGSVEDYV